MPSWVGEQDDRSLAETNNGTPNRVSLLPTPKEKGKKKSSIL